MVECGFHTLKRFRAVATRYGKTATNVLPIVHVACITMWLNSGHPLVDKRPVTPPIHFRTNIDRLTNEAHT